MTNIDTRYLELDKHRHIILVLDKHWDTSFCLDTHYLVLDKHLDTVFYKMSIMFISSETYTTSCVTVLSPCFKYVTTGCMVTWSTCQWALWHSSCWRNAKFSAKSRTLQATWFLKTFFHCIELFVLPCCLKQMNCETT